MLYNQARTTFHGVDTSEDGGSVASGGSVRLMAGLSISGLQTSMRYCCIEPRAQGAFAVCASQLCRNFGDTDWTQEHPSIYIRAALNEVTARALTLHAFPDCWVRAIVSLDP